MLTATEVGGFVGAGLAGAAYVPQISHLIRARCSAGISRLAFAVWLVASVLVTARAIAICAGVFIVLGGVQIVATALIMVYAARYKDTPCPGHLPRPPRGRAAARAGCRVAEPAMPAGDGAVRSYVPVGHPPSSAVTPRSGRAARARAGRSLPRPRRAAAAPGAEFTRSGESRSRSELQPTHLKETT